MEDSIMDSNFKHMPAKESNHFTLKYILQRNKSNIYIYIEQTLLKTCTLMFTTAVAEV